MKITLIEPRGFCFGVCRALKMLDTVLLQKPYVLHNIVHNKQVVNDYKAKGVFFVDNLDEVPTGRHLVLSAHGVSKKVEEIARKNFIVTDTTCPFVKKNHLWVRQLEKENIPVIIIGKKEHAETIGTLGQLENLKNAFVVSSVDDVKELPNFSKIGVAVQTTFSLTDCAQIIDALRNKYVQVLFQMGICDATEKRQQAVQLAAKTHQMILVVGDRTSSNAKRLIEVAKNAGANSVLVETVDDLKNIKFPERVAITAAASAPDEIVAQVASFLSRI